MMSQTRLLNLLHQIGRAEPVNLYALAFMMTESHFRGPFLRACEIAWMLVCFGILRRNPNLTLGVCQVKIDYWTEMFGRRSSKLVWAIMDDKSNYRICCKYLDDHKLGSLEASAIQYNGRPSCLYVQHLTLNLARVNSAMQPALI
jgi:hypothetical protein